ncbi:DNA-3-methyladenine glycosylase 2 family protein [Marinobacter sp. CHS3-4]|uniref:DNA-3-methyladenine glycosylase family protein n=1 Tax=Marinobacter sp. CHS3-4 TaxID=3045174 RepID=UPI0024B581C8|nr:DNA-3-methyladenine glycosylase 2 family protein [Marinobacter sp. CHS3-4]MDI9246866.1 DNA-3-methyladenine glycosylase 2 family protein [Marinobacter sp. CHS3-4]
MSSKRHQALNTETLETAIDELVSLDPDLEPVVRQYGTPPLWGREPGFTTLVQIILEQQISLKAAQTVFQRLSDHLGGITPANVLAVGEVGLKARGLTRQKSRYCHELALHVTDGRLALDSLADEPYVDGKKALLAVPGLGEWSVDVYYMMALKHPDVWPHGDLALASAMQGIKGLDQPPKRDQQTVIAEVWKPWRAVAARLLWVHYLAERGQYP